MRYSFCLFLAATAIIGAVCVPTLAAEGVVRLISADESRIVLEIRTGEHRFVPSRFVDGAETLEIAGFGSFSVAGEPLIPGRDVLVALPPDGAASLTYSVLSSQPLGRHRLEPVPFPVVFRSEDGLLGSSSEYRIDADAYERGRGVIGVSAQPQGRLRNQRVLPVRVEPVGYDPSTGEIILATLIRVEITLSGGGRSRGAPVQEIDVWERIYSRVLVNPDQARGWRSKPVGRIPDPGKSQSVIQGGPLVKLAVRKSGMHRVTASEVIARGFPSGTATTQLQLFQRGYDDVWLTHDIVDIPFKLIEDGGGVAGEFDASDAIIFYGQELRVDTLRNDPIEKFSEDNIYWLGVAPGAQMTQTTLSAGTVTPDTATATFPVTRYEEQDLFFMENTPETDAVTRARMREFYYYNAAPDPSFSVPFTIGAIKSATTFELRARFLGGHKYTVQRNVRIEIVNSKGTTRLNDAVVPISTVVYYSSGALSADILSDGFNTLRIQPVGRGTLEALLDWFTIEYESPYQARGDMLEFNTGALSGNQNLTVTGLSRTDVLLFDVTDPLAPEEYPLDGSHFTPLGGGEYALSFQIDLTAPRRFILVPPDKIDDVAEVIEDQPSNLIGNPIESGVDILVVSHKDFLAGIQRWVDYRRAQGYRVLLTDVDDVFDEFNGGVNNARAIRTLVEHFFAKGGVSFLLLVGDASEDNKRVHIESGINFVPTESFTEHVQSSVFNEDEVVTSDKWYGMLGADIIYENAPFPADYYPDVIVGRLPAGTVEELDILIDKTLEFEKPSGSDFWRRRMIRCADDNWSGAGTTCLQPPEVDFEVAEEVAAVITQSSIPGGYDIVRFYLSDRISHPPGGCVGAGSQIHLARTEATPALLGELAKGATILSFQAHMNRYQICHERLFTSSVTAEGGPDPGKLANTGRPFVVFGMGCHISDFALHKELIRVWDNPPTGDCMSEILLHLDNKGAVNSYGSTGFEYLRENKNYTAVIAEVFFSDPPVGPTLPSNRSQVRWIMGELMATAEIENLLRFPVGSGLGARGQAKRYHTLGDPVLRMDAGPPRFEVTVNGEPFESGDLLFASGAGDSVRVRGVITDEVAIEEVSLEIDGVDATGQMTITPTRDVGLDAARQYEIAFATTILPKPYDIIIRAHQAADTTAGEYHVVAEFVLRVEINASLAINGRPVVDGDLVAAEGDYVFELESPVFVDPSLIRVEIDDSTVTPLDFSHPSPQDSTTWLVAFSASLAPGAHTISIFVDNASFDYNVSVGSQAGVRDLIAYPNPFQDDTYFVYSNDLEISGGAIDIFTASGKKVAHLELPTSARMVGQNAVRWDGRTWNGDPVANGLYLYVFSVNQLGQTSTQRGKLVRVR